MAVPFYAMTAYFAVRAAVDAAAVTTRRTLAVSAMLLVLGAGWELRAIGTVEAVHITAWKAHRQWLADPYQRRITFSNRPTYLRILDAMTRQGTITTPARLFTDETDAWLLER
jgi:hypothetical protein